MFKKKKTLKRVDKYLFIEIISSDSDNSNKNFI
jgi:hypothetical protein